MAQDFDQNMHIPSIFSKTTDTRPYRLDLFDFLDDFFMQIHLI